jgi:hypothetical protein
LDPQVDLAHLKAGEFEAEIEANQRELFELLGQQLVVPVDVFDQFISAIMKARACARVR